MQFAYPNLAEIINYHPYHIASFAGFAEVTVELLKAGIMGRESLEESEIFNIARYAGLPYSVLKCPKMIYLYKSRYRHQQMIESLEKKLYEIWEAQKNGSREADLYMRYGRLGLVNMMLDFQNTGKVTYGRYLGILENLNQTISFIQSERRKPRDITRKTA